MSCLFGTLFLQPCMFTTIHTSIVFVAEQSFNSVQSLLGHSSAGAVARRFVPRNVAPLLVAPAPPASPAPPTAPPAAAFAALPLGAAAFLAAGFGFAAALVALVAVAAWPLGVLGLALGIGPGLGLGLLGLRIRLAVARARARASLGRRGAPLEGE